jgi:arabinose-5-phosphate isomerase
MPATQFTSDADSLVEDLRPATTFSPSSDKDMCAHFQAVLERERASLEVVAARMSNQSASLQEACDILGRRDKLTSPQSRVIVSGIGKAGLIGKKVAATLTSTGTSAIFIHPVEAMHGDLGLVNATDVGLLFSYSGETPEVLRLAETLQRFECELVCVTRSASSSLGRICRVSLELGEIEEACELGLAPSSSTTAMLAVGDALALTVARCEGFSAADFARNHPGGALGLRFRSVASAMRSGERVVRIAPETRIREVVRVVTAARTGAAVLVDSRGHLVGIFTDGDLRRALLTSGPILDLPVREFSTIPCKWISSEASLYEAVQLFHRTRTEDLPVLDRDKLVVGMLCLKDVTFL